MLLRDNIDPREQLRVWRTGVQLSQAQMAKLMGMPLRTYEDLERGHVVTRPIHINAACMALIQHAADNRGRLDVPADLLDIVERATR